MSNPFAVLASDDEDEKYIKPEEKKSKKIQDERKQYKKKVDSNEPKTSVPNESLPERIREDAKVIRNRRAPPPNKNISEGHTFDRRSGTGRTDKVRKQGGGKGNLGNIKDEQNRDKYAENTTEDINQEEELKPEEIKSITLDEYYKNKGIELNTEAVQKKQSKKPSDIHADWIKKQKLVVMETKEGKKLNDRNQVQVGNRQQQQSNYIEINAENSDILGFNTKPQQKPRVERDEIDKDRRAVKKKVVSLKQEDFPTL